MKVTCYPNEGKELKKLKRRIRECEAEIANICTLPYYTIFNRESERAADLEAAMRKLNSLQYSACRQTQVAVGRNFTQAS